MTVGTLNITGGTGSFQNLDATTVNVSANGKLVAGNFTEGSDTYSGTVEIDKIVIADNNTNANSIKNATAIGDVTLGTKAALTIMGVGTENESSWTPVGYIGGATKVAEGATLTVGDIMLNSLEVDGTVEVAGTNAGQGIDADGNSYNMTTVSGLVKINDGGTLTTNSSNNDDLYITGNVANNGTILSEGGSIQLAGTTTNNGLIKTDVTGTSYGLSIAGTLNNNAVAAATRAAATDATSGLVTSTQAYIANNGTIVNKGIISGNLHNGTRAYTSTIDNAGYAAYARAGKLSLEKGCDLTAAVIANEASSTIDIYTENTAEPGDNTLSKTMLTNYGTINVALTSNAKEMTFGTLVNEVEGAVVNVTKGKVTCNGMGHLGSNQTGCRR